MKKKIIAMFILINVLLLSNVQAYTMLSRSIEIENGDRYNHQFSPNIIGKNEGNASSLIKSVAEDVIKVTQNPTCDKFIVETLKSEELNAFTVPNGHIYVTFPLMEFLGTYDELAFVIGHEIGHEQSNHYLDTTEKMAEEQFGAAMWDWRKVKSKVIDFSYSVIPSLIKYGYGIQREYEADAYSFMLLTKTDYNLGAGAIFLHKVIKNSYNPQLQNYLNAHKNNTTRLNRQLAYLKYWSNDKVEVVEESIFINGVFIVKPTENKKFDNFERTYYIAGNFARALHEKNTNFNLVNNEKIMWNGITVIKPTGNDEEASVIFERLQLALRK